MNIACVNCHSGDYLCDKAIGIGAGEWEICCKSCSEFIACGLDGCDEKHEIPFTELKRMQLEFNNCTPEIRGAILDQVRTLAETYDYLIEPQTCKCGEKFSIYAFPRCHSCNAVLLESPFHYA